MIKLKPGQMSCKLTTTTVTELDPPNYPKFDGNIHSSKQLLATLAKDSSTFLLSSQQLTYLPSLLKKRNFARLCFYQSPKSNYPFTKGSFKKCT